RSWRSHRRARCRRQNLHAVPVTELPVPRLWTAGRRRHVATRYGRARDRRHRAGESSADRRDHRRQHRVESVRRARRLVERQQPALRSLRSRVRDVVTPAPVAVTAPRRSEHGRERVTLNTAYVRALECSGLVPLAVPTMLAPDRAAAALESVRGLVLTGGEDVAPQRYGASPHPRLG